MTANFEQHRAVFIEALRVDGKSKATVRTRREGLGVLFRFLAEKGIEDVREVNRDVVNGYLLWLKGHKYTAWTVDAYWQTARRFFAYLEKTDVILLDPCNGVKTPKLSRQLPKSLSSRQARKLVNAPDTTTPKGLRDQAILELFYSTGIRLGEMAALQVYDVDSRGGLVRVQGKGRKERIVPMGQKAVESLQRYLREARAVWLRGRAASSALWLSAIEPHGPLGALRIQVMVRSYGKEVGVKVTPHLWRHTCATHLLSNGTNIAYVQRLLGHSSLNTTQVYTKVVVPELKATHARKHPRAKVKPPTKRANEP
jgi:integrase/recombinase XerD